jgi:hypothetical protein
MGDYPENPARQFASAWQAATAAVGQWRTQVTAATTEAVEKLDPALRTALDAARAVLAGNWGVCQCPCDSVHPADMNVCDGRAVLTRRVAGLSEMPLCAPCAVAQGVAEMPH